MIALAISLAAIILLLVGGMMFLVHSSLDSKDSEGHTFAELATKEGELERINFALEVTQKSLEAANRRADALEEELAHALVTAHPDLPAGDVAARLVRFSQLWGAADAARGALPAKPGAAVPAPSAAAAPGAPAVPDGTARKLPG